jgi:hypothetical protein
MERGCNTERLGLGSIYVVVVYDGAMVAATATDPPHAVAGCMHMEMQGKFIQTSRTHEILFGRRNAHSAQHIHPSPIHSLTTYLSSPILDTRQSCP